MEEKKTPIKPSDINTREHFWNSFGNFETEVSARLIVKMCQKKDDTWEPFTQADLNKACSNSKFRLNNLENTYVKQRDDGKFEVTKKFIGKCYAASPA